MTKPHSNTPPSDTPEAAHSTQSARRQCLCRLTQVVGAAGVALAAWPLVSALGPDEKTLANNAPLDIDLSQMQPGQVLRKIWRGKLVLIHYRTEAEIAAAKACDALPQLDPQLDAERVKPGHEQWLVMFGNCPHAGCIPLIDESISGWLCPCHGSEFDTSGRVTKGPSPTNLQIPDYVFLPNELTIRLGVTEV